MIWLNFGTAVSFRVTFVSVVNMIEFVCLFIKTLQTRNRIYKLNDCSPTKNGVASTFMFPFWFTTTIALRDLASGINGNMVQSFEMQTEGLFWFKNLVQADPYYILPIVYAIINVANVKVNDRWSYLHFNEHGKWEPHNGSASTVISIKFSRKSTNFVMQLCHRISEICKVNDLYVIM